MTALACSILPLHTPRYLMGVGTPVNILTAIGLGVDMFDCVLPSRNARHGMLFTWKGIINIRNAKYKTDFSPIDPDSELETDLRYSKAYLRHLFVCNELLALRLATLHNLHFYLDLVTTARNHILEGDFDAWKEKVLPDLGKRI
jgi:queuine tRNA-ribosyltransferase